MLENDVAAVRSELCRVCQDDCGVEGWIALPEPVVPAKGECPEPVVPAGEVDDEAEAVFSCKVLSSFLDLKLLMGNMRCPDKAFSMACLRVPGHMFIEQPAGPGK